MTDIQNLQGARATVVGLGIEGIDLVRYLTTEGAIVTVSHIRTSEALIKEINEISDCAPHLSLGKNRVEDCSEADAVFVSQGVPPDLPALRAARHAKIPISSMTQLFVERCPSPIAGITGSSGKQQRLLLPALCSTLPESTT